MMYVWTKCMDFVYMLTTKFPDSLKKKMKEGKKEERGRGHREGRKKIGELTRMIRFSFVGKKITCPHTIIFYYFIENKHLK